MIKIKNINKIDNNLEIKKYQNVKLSYGFIY